MRYLIILAALLMPLQMASYASAQAADEIKPQEGLPAPGVLVDRLETLTKGMSMQEVEAALGVKGEVVIAPRGETWFYIYETSEGGELIFVVAFLEDEFFRYQAYSRE